MSVRVHYNYIYAYSFAVEMGCNGYHGEVRVRAYVDSISCLATYKAGNVLD